jgi:hypothetical protein
MGWMAGKKLPVLIGVIFIFLVELADKCHLDFESKCSRIVRSPVLGGKKPGLKDNQSP